MGLDMYLKADVYVPQHKYINDEFVPNEEFVAIVNALNLSHYGTDLFGSGIGVDVPMGYWRKANAIHNWFVQNVQDGEDNCGTYFVGRDHLEDLAKTCQEVLADPSKAEELLPTGEGFFFGSTDYDEYYIETLNDTVDIVSRCLASPYDYFEYSSSW